MDRDWNFEASLDELLDEEVMEPVLRSAGIDTQGFRDMIHDAARRREARDTAGADPADA